MVIDVVCVVGLQEKQNLKWITKYL